MIGDPCYLVSGTVVNGGDHEAAVTVCDSVRRARESFERLLDGGGIELPRDEQKLRLVGKPLHLHPRNIDDLCLEAAALAEVRDDSKHPTHHDGRDTQPNGKDVINRFL